jgi:hypothetical protein
MHDHDEDQEQSSEDFLDQIYDKAIMDSGPDGLNLEETDAKAEEQWLRANRDHEIKSPTLRDIARREVARAKRRAGQKGRAALAIIRGAQMIFETMDELLKDCGFRVDGETFKRIRYATQFDLDARIAWLRSKNSNLSESITGQIEDCEYLKTLIVDRPYLG